MREYSNFGRKGFNSPDWLQLLVEVMEIHFIMAERMEGGTGTEAEIMEEGCLPACQAYFLVKLRSTCRGWQDSQGAGHPTIIISQENELGGGGGGAHL